MLSREIGTRVAVSGRVIPADRATLLMIAIETWLRHSHGGRVAKPDINDANRDKQRGHHQ